MLGCETLHPLIAVLDFSTLPNAIEECMISTEFYTIMVKDGYCGELKYGRNRYDYDEETMLFFAPHQVIGNRKTTVVC